MQCVWQWLVCQTPSNTSQDINKDAIEMYVMTHRVIVLKMLLRMIAVIRIERICILYFRHVDSLALDVSLFATPSPLFQSHTRPPTFALKLAHAQQP